MKERREGGEGERDPGRQVYGLGASKGVNLQMSSHLPSLGLRACEIGRLAVDGGSCVPCPPLGHPLRCGGDKGDFVFQPDGEPTKV